MSQQTGDLVWFHDHLGDPIYVDSSGYDKYNPVNHTNEWATPALIIANELDYRVPVEQGLAVFQILQAKGIASRFLSFPDEAHVTEKPDNRLHWWRTVLAWCAQRIKVHDAWQNSVSLSLCGFILDYVSRFTSSTPSRPIDKQQ